MRPNEPLLGVSAYLVDRGLEAWLRVTPNVPLTEDEIRRALQDAHVSVGIDDELIRQLAETPPQEDVLIARGEPPQHGADAVIDFLFVGDPRAYDPLQDEQGRIDFREAFLIPVVDAGAVVARKIVATLGTPGRTVTGEPIPAKPGKDRHLKPGKNVVLGEDHLSLRATIDGIAKVSSSRLDVLPVFQVKDVDFSSGNINFQGTVQVFGNVLPGFSIKATEDIIVNGVVEQGTLEAGGSIRVAAGVRAESRLGALQDIHVKFCDSGSELKAGRNIYVAVDAVNSVLSAGHNIEIDRYLIGGVARAAETIQANRIGNPAETPTQIELVQDGGKERIELMSAELEQLEAKLGQICTAIKNAMQRAEAGVAEIIKRLTPTKVLLHLQVNRLRAQLSEVRDEQASLAPPRLVVKSELHPGVMIQFATQAGKRREEIRCKQQAKTILLDSDAS